MDGTEAPGVTERNVIDGPLEGSGAGSVPVPYEHPGYRFSGANMGGQSLHLCLSCAGLVQDENTPIHTDWHVRAGH